jgi:peptide-methionine (S)-S-oxide reductase
MSSSDGAPRALPDRPSKEHLRKQAKRLAKDQSLKLAEAQRALAREYGLSSWADLMRRVEDMRGDEPAPSLSPLSLAARAGDVAAVRRLLAGGDQVDGTGDEGGTPLFHVCASDAPDTDRMAVAELLLSAGASTRRDDAGATALHAAAARGPLTLVELLIRAGALEWQGDAKGRPLLDAAQRGSAADRAAIIELLDRPVIRDPSFRAAVTAIHCGDVDGLSRLLDAEPRLLRERIVEPACYREAGRGQYFLDPKLFWFIANNPTLVKRMPENIGAIAAAMIARGVDKADLDYALELVMTSAPARDQGFQVALMGQLLRAGAEASPAAIDGALGHRELAPIKALLDAGYKMTASIAAAMGDADRLAELLRAASADEKQRALSMAVINGHTAAARVALDAGADCNLFLTVHQHSVPLHQAALDENIELMELLIARGARTDIRDTMWNSTPLGWARHEGKAKAVAFLERLENARGI